MALSCQKLAQRYAAETGKPVPGPDAGFQARSDWLLTQQWGCILPGTTEFHDNKDGFCAQNNDLKAPPASGTVGPGHPSSTIPSTVSTRQPYLNYLKEDGFLHWVNQRGMQCVNRLVGNFYGFDTQTGNARTPGLNVTPAPSLCWGACFNASSNSATCFECVNQQLLANPSLCPQLNPNNPDDESLIQDSLLCHECVGTQNVFVQQAGADPGVPDQNAMVNNIWQCITGTVSQGLSTATIVIIVVVVVFVVTIALTLGIYYGVIHPKILAREAVRHKMMEEGLDPDDYSTSINTTSVTQL